LHHLVRCNFQRRRTVVSGVDEQWQADLIDLPNPKLFTNGHTFVLIVVEKLYNLAWPEPLKNKTSKSFFKTFAKILNRGGLKTLFLHTQCNFISCTLLVSRHLENVPGSHYDLLSKQHMTTRYVL